MKRRRCAIYTRKSSEEGLEQDFNSLDAQREACAAYIVSQASEGWTLIERAYDDGGLSGGTLERPALKRLIADIEHQAIDIVVVYKVDRLTRSLLDFAKLVEHFDRAEVSFVSVTQSFNTTTSMGRLTLNMLLSFAQFEREVTAERIRDKIAASKAKGMWMGGIPPLGYQPDGRSLAVVEEHAVLIRRIYRRYLALGNVRLLAEDLAASGIITPLRQTAQGKAFGASLFSRGQLYKILRNPVYRGRIAHKDKVYDGNHPAIIEDTLWHKVQQQLDANGQGRHNPGRHDQGQNCHGQNNQGPRVPRETRKALLAGLLRDADGARLVSVHTSKPHRLDAQGAKLRYRYYVGKEAAPGNAPGAPRVLRIPAPQIERIVLDELTAFFEDPLSLLARAGITDDISRAQLEDITGNCQAIAAQLASPDNAWLKRLIESIAVHPDHLELRLRPAKLLGSASSDPSAHKDASIKLRIEAKLTRTGHVLKLIDTKGVATSGAMRDPRMIKLLQQAHHWWSILQQGELTIAELARNEGLTHSYVTRIVRLAFLSPQVTEAILTGRQRADLTIGDLEATDAIDPDWTIQRRSFLDAGI